MKALITGGGGFLGSAIARLLVERGDTARSLSRGRYDALDALGVEQFQGDLRNPAPIRRAMEGCDVVFHVAARVGAWGAYEEFYLPNVLGTWNIIHACRQLGVERLVFTSSPSVIFNGSDMEGVDESVPYPDHYETHYPRTKAEAERLVLDADSADDGLRTVSLRPHLVWGPRDTNLVPRILSRARSGQLVRLKGPPKLIDVVYIDDAARAHVQAADALRDAPERVGGRAYFITSGEPVETWTMVNRILAAGGLPPLSKAVPVPVAYGIASAMEAAWSAMGREDEPRLTRWVVSELATAHWFDISAARRDLGYAPQVSLDEGMAHLEAWLRAEG